MMIDRDYDWTGGLIFFIFLFEEREGKYSTVIRNRDHIIPLLSNAAHLTELFNHRCLYRVYQ